MAVEKTPPRPTTAMQRVRRIDGSAARGGQMLPAGTFCYQLVIGPEVPLVDY
jgi:hypothetical protein